MEKEVILLGGGSLFAKILEAPPAISGDDLRGYVETLAERLSPLPPESLRFSYMRKGKILVLFAGSKDRLFSAYGKTAVENAVLAVPAAALLKNAELPDGFSLFEAADSIALIEKENGEWKDFLSSPVRGNRRETSVALLRAAGRDESVEDVAFFVLAKHAFRSSKVEFELLQYRGVPPGDGGGSPIVNALKLSVSKRELLESDIRDKNAMRKAGVEKRRKAMARAKACTPPALFAFLLLSQCVQWCELSGLKKLESEYAEMEPRAKLAELKGEEIAKMLQFTENLPLPVEALAAVNASRPDSVAFARTSVLGGKDIEIKATAPSISAANSYLEALKLNKKIASVEAKTETSKNGAKLTAAVKLR